MHSNRHTRSKITRWCIKVVGQKKTKILGESLLKSHGASIQILITDSSVALAIELLSFGLWEPSTTKSLAPRLIRISHSQNVELYSTHGGGCYCKKSIRIRTNLWCAYVNFFLFFGSVRTNLWMMWISFWLSGRSCIIMMWMNCWTPCWSSQLTSLPKGATWNVNELTCLGPNEKLRAFTVIFSSDDDRNPMDRCTQVN